MIKINRLLNELDKNNIKHSFTGDKEQEFEGFSSLKCYEENSLTWIGRRDAIPEECDFSRITVAVVQKGITVPISNQIISENSKETFFLLLKQVFSRRTERLLRVGTAIGEQVVLGADVQIGCNCVFDGDIIIGDRTIIEHNVVIMNSVSIGSDCIIHSGTIIGKDGFGFSYDENNVPQKVTHFGGVKIGNRVEIGANCTVDRGTIDNTIIEDDVKIDNLVLIAHNTHIGQDVLVIGCTDLAGSSSVGEKSYIGPQVCVKNQISVGKNSFVGMDVMVNKSIGDNVMLVNENKTKCLPCKNFRRFL